MDYQTAKMEESIQEVLFSAEELVAKAKEMGERITEDYEGKNPLIVCILKGSFMFLTDMVRHVDLMCNVDFMAVSSYGSGTTSSGEVRILKDTSASITGRHVIIVEDILDTGTTLCSLMGVLKARGALSVEICTLLSKPARHKVEVDVKYLGYEIPDAFVVGYGLDYNEQYRNLPYIGVLKPAVYSK